MKGYYSLPKIGDYCEEFIERVNQDIFGVREIDEDVFARKCSQEKEARNFGIGMTGRNRALHDCVSQLICGTEGATLRYEVTW